MIFFIQNLNFFWVSSRIEAEAPVEEKVVEKVVEKPEEEEGEAGGKSEPKKIIKPRGPKNTDQILKEDLFQKFEEDLFKWHRVTILETKKSETKYFSFFKIWTQKYEKKKKSWSI